MSRPPGDVLGMSPPPTPSSEDDIIPTAIVIPFSVKHETLLEIIAPLSIPMSYAFNYHVDAQGAFRGLAFANFRLPQYADALVAALNAFDVQGRKLRVEYKKILQAGEKALHHMRSMQTERECQAQAAAAAYIRAFCSSRMRWSIFRLPTVCS
jgi:RNA recognition motif-containing protein